MAKAPPTSKSPPTAAMTTPRRELFTVTRVGIGVAEPPSVTAPDASEAGTTGEGRTTVGCSMPDTASSISCERTLMRSPSVAMRTVATFMSETESFSFTSQTSSARPSSSAV
jgi:hypothetical protein